VGGKRGLGEGYEPPAGNSFGKGEKSMVFRRTEMEGSVHGEMVMNFEEPAQTKKQVQKTSFHIRDDRITFGSAGS
jgi:hypothetical protein